ncbi:MAG: tyrosine--tRNA ligase [Micavibrio sp.]|nr:tyrosine--tRNA ligase [Micavibrio sp.]
MSPAPARINEILAFFDRTSDQFFSKDEFKAKLKSGKKLRIKYGVDVTAPTLHIGHAVNMWLMRYLQDLGHQVVFLIGDFTTRIGDPDGRSETRPQIPREDIERNAREFIEQAKMVLRFDDPELLEIRRNSEWLDQMKMQDFMNLLAMVTHTRLLSRDMFQKRIELHKDIHMHEIIYPVLQGYDSVAIEADMTIIGSDQLFNEMMGRFFQERMGQKQQTIITTKITPGTDGKGKQSKSVGNYIGLAHSPRDKFGRVMNIPDTLIEQYFVIYTDLPMMDIAALKNEIAHKPRDAKMKLAEAIVARYHGKQVAAWEKEWFENTISKGNAPDDIPTLPILTPRIEALSLVSLARPGKSKSDTRRLISQGGVEINGDKLQKADETLLVQTGDILKVGKRGWFRLEIVKPNELETERLWLKPLHLHDIDLVRKYMPEWEIVKYLGKMPVPKKVAASLATEVFKKVILQPEPKDEWLWKITQKKAPDDIIGVGHLHRSSPGEGNQNVWLIPEARDEGLMAEAMMAINEHAFHQLGFNSMMFKEAFAFATAPKEGDALRRAYMSLDPVQRDRDTPDGAWGFTKEGWQQMQAWRRRTMGLPEPNAAPAAPAAAPEAEKPAEAKPLKTTRRKLTTEQNPFMPPSPKPSGKV